MLTVLLWTVAALFSISLIVKNSLSASYFTYKDEYWTIYYEKPYARLPAYLIGVVWGCSYYSYKHEREEEDQLFAGMTPDQIHRRRQQLHLEEEDPGSYQGQKYPKNMLIALFNKLAVSKLSAILVIVAGFASAVILVAIVTSINASPIDSKHFLNTMFLMFQRPLFVTAASFAFMPIMLRNPMTYPITASLEHSFWYPLARLSYGAYLSAGIFMLYHMYDKERGLWASEMDSFFLFMAYLSFAFLFSFLITIVVEKPCHNLFDTFILGTDREVYLRGPSSSLKSVTASSSKRPGTRGAPRRGKSGMDEDSESDAETLDNLDDEGGDGNFLTNSAYNRSGRSEPVLDPEDGLRGNSSKKQSSVSFPSTRSAANSRQQPAPAPSKQATAKPAPQTSSTTLKAPLLSNERAPPAQSSQPARATGSVNRGGSKRAEPEIVEEKKPSAPADDDGLYFLE